MIKMIRFSLAATALCGGVLGAYAADLSQPPRVLNYPPQAADHAPATGWYLRGDVGVGRIWSSKSDWSETYINSSSGSATTGWTNQSLGDSVLIGTGVGYQFTENLRGDITAQYRTATQFQGGNYLTSGSSTVANAINGSVSSTVFLMNGYYDITNFNGLTPYVGAGVGAAYNQMRSANAISTGSYASALTNYGNAGKLNFAWALHTGLSYDINPRLKLEMGYSFSSLGEAQSNWSTCYGSVSNCGGQFKINRLYSNDVHIGMRWQFDPQTTTHASYQPSSWQQPVSGNQSSAPVVARY